MHSLYLITILQELQSLVQILPVHGDESHHHIAVACDNNKEKSKTQSLYWS